MRKNYTLLLLILLGFNLSVLSQNPVWTLPPNYTDFVFTDALPTPTDPNNTYDSEDEFYYYQGQSAEVTHNSMVDAQGNLLFFIVDDIVYDSEGYAMGWLINFSPQVLMKGTSEMVIVPDPGNCFRYYIIGNGLTNYNGNANHYPYYAILDLSENNEFFTGRKGSLVLNSQSTVLNSIATIVDVPPFDESWDNSGMGGVYFAVTPKRQDNTHLLFISSPQYIFTFEINGTGIDYLSNRTITVDFPFLDEQSSMRAEMEVKELSTGDYFIAHPFIHSPNGTGAKKIAILFTALNSSGFEYSGAKRIYTLDIVDNEVPKISGLEFSESGQHLYLTHLDVTDRSSCVEYIDLEETNLDIIPLAVDGNKGKDYQYSQLEMGLDNKIYAVRDNPSTELGVALASLSSTDSPNVTNWNATAISISFAPNYMALPSQYQNSIDRKYILPDQIDGFNYTSFYEENLLCCIATRTGNDTLIITQTQTWTASMSNPPFEIENGIVYVKEELRIKAGAVLTLEDMEFHFSPDAKVIVERGTSSTPGGKLILKNTTFTADIRCAEELMWQGVEVHGHRDEIQGFPNPSSASHNSIQGAIYVLEDSKIEHAYKGITTGVVYVNGTIDSQFAGGIVVADNSTFFNNEIDVAFASYPKLNKSIFTQTNFITNGLLNKPQVNPYYHIGFWGVDDVYVKGCQIINETPELYLPDQQGIGIAAINSRFFVDADCGMFPSCATPVRSHIENMSQGIMALGLFMSMPYKIDRTDFVNNYKGIYTSNLNRFVIQRCNFEVYKSASPNYVFETVGLHIDNCTGFIVQENHFEEANDVSGEGNTIGIIVNNAGERDNEIYKNTFSNLRVGGQSQGINSVAYNPSLNYPNNQGLRWRCNEFSDNLYEADLAVSSGRIAYQQGYCLPVGNVMANKTPAGNKFSHSENTVQNDIWTNPGVLAFNYAHHADNSTTPYDYGNAVNPQYCASNGPVYFSTTHSCPSKVQQGLVADVITGITASIGSYTASINAKIDMVIAGANSNLITLINNPHVSSGQKLDTLLAYSPLLSDQVIEAYFYSEPPVEHSMQVIIANSPLSDTIWNAILQLDIPQYLIDTLTHYQVTPSLKTEIYNEFYFELTETTLLLNELIGTYWLDTTIVGGRDSVLQLIELAYTGVDLYKERIGYYYALEDWTQMENARQDYMNEVGNDGFSRWVQDIIVASPQNCPNPAMYDPEDSLYVEDCVSLEGLVMIAIGQLYDFSIEPLYTSSSLVVTANPEESKLSDDMTSIEATIYPNPASDSFFVTFNHSIHNDDEVSVKVYSLSGHLISNQNFTNITHVNPIEVNALNSGLYLVVIGINGTDISTQKLMIK